MTLDKPFLKFLGALGLLLSFAVTLTALFVGVRANWADPSEVEWLIGSILVPITFLIRRQYLLRNNRRDTALAEYGWVTIILLFLGIIAGLWWVVGFGANLS